MVILSTLAESTQLFDLAYESYVVTNYCARIASRSQVLTGMKTEAASNAETTDAATVNACSVRLGRVFNQVDARFTTGGKQIQHRRWFAVKMNRDDGAGAWCNRVGRSHSVHQKAVFLGVDQNRCSSRKVDGSHSCVKGISMSNDFVARPYAKGEQAEQ